MSFLAKHCQMNPMSFPRRRESRKITLNIGKKVIYLKNKPKKISFL
ncbi:MAG TPA: hypothetical protein LFV92_02225 [Rickettsia endosymbiont of Ceroptres masudai]|nr:hypothetical protein [Rickettsia endosymbiont of Ceroptres masudai]